jgi:hypothetical protein
MTRASRTAEWKAEGSAMRGPVRRHLAVRIVCRYILMYARSIRRVNPTDFDGHPKSQEKPEIAPVDRLRVTTKRGGRDLARRAYISEKDSRVAS